MWNLLNKIFAIAFLKWSTMRLEIQWVCSRKSQKEIKWSHLLRVFRPMQNDSNGNDANDGQFRRRNTCAFHECGANNRIAQLCTKHFANEGRKKTNIGYLLSLYIYYNKCNVRKNFHVYISAKKLMKIFTHHDLP